MRSAGLAGFVVLTYLPILALCLPLLQALVGPASTAADVLALALPRGRQLGLLQSSLGIAFFSTLLAGLLGGLAALSGFPRHRLLRGLPLVLIAVPPYVHALAWSTLWFRLGLYAGELGLDLNSAGPGMAVFVLAMARLPLAYGLALVAVGLLPAELIDAARLSRRPGSILVRIVLPLAAPIAAAGLALAFLLSLHDYGVPALFQVQVLALGVFADYSATGDAARALAMSLPLLVFAALACLGLVAGWRRAALASPRADAHRPPGAPPGSLPMAVSRLARLSMLLIFIQAGLLLLSLIMAAGSSSRVLESMAPAREDLIYSLLVALAAALLSIGPALAFADLLGASKRSGLRRILLWLAAALPMAIPAPLFGIGLIRLWRSAPLALLPADALLPVIASAGRFLPLAVMILGATLSRRDSSQIDAGRVHQASSWQGWWFVSLPLTAAGLLAASGIVFALSLGELGATLMVLPPGRSTLAVRTFNYLHYGASDAVAGACLVLALLTFLAAAAALHGLSLSQGLTRGSEGAQ